MFPDFPIKEKVYVRAALKYWAFLPLDIMITDTCLSLVGYSFSINSIKAWSFPTETSGNAINVC